MKSLVPLIKGSILPEGKVTNGIQKFKVEASCIMLLPGYEYYTAMEQSVKDPGEADVVNCIGLLQGVVSFLREKTLMIQVFFFEEDYG